MKQFIFVILLMLTGVLYWSCGGSETEKQQPPQQETATTQEGTEQLTEWELEHGIGPINSPLKLGPIDDALAQKGEEVFDLKCVACHKLDERYVGPPLRDVTKRRTPEFIMNQILDPDEMVKRHPEVKKMLATYLTPMTFQNVTEEDARAILEYFRKVAEEAPSK